MAVGTLGVLVLRGLLARVPQGRLPACAARLCRAASPFRIITADLEREMAPGPKARRHLQGDRQIYGDQSSIFCLTVSPAEPSCEQDSSMVLSPLRTALVSSLKRPSAPVTSRMPSRSLSGTWMPNALIGTWLWQVLIGTLNMLAETLTKTPE